MNLEVALGSFWQLARHWRQGESAKLELSCEDGNLQLQLSAKLGHPDSIHFPDPGPAPSPHVKKKSPSQLRRQERRRKEAVTEADKALTTPKPTEIVITVSENITPIDTKEAHESSNVAETPVLSTLPFKCDQCEFVGASEKGVKQHTRLKHRISQLDGQDDHEESESVKSPCPLCPVWEYCKCGKCEECDYISTEEGLNVHIMNDHEPRDVINHFKVDWIQKRKHFIKRNLKYAQDRFHSQKWDSAMVL